MDGMEGIRAIFFEECAELLEALEDDLLSLQEGRDVDGTVDAIFRAVHSIKGGAGAFSMEALVAFAHDLETRLEALRTGAEVVTADLCAMLLRAADHLSDLVAAARDGREGPEAPSGLVAMLAASPPSTAAVAFVPIPFDLGDAASEGVAEPASEPGGTFPASRDGIEREGSAKGHPEAWCICFGPREELLESGNEPLHLLRALGVLGHLEVRLSTADLPPLAQLDPGAATLSWQVRLTPSAPGLTRTEIEAVFEFAEDLCDISIDPWRATPCMLPGPEAATPCSQVSESPAQGEPRAAAAPTTIRVDLERVDRLVNLVGELVIGQSVLAQAVEGSGRSEAEAALDDLHGLAREIQDGVMAIRAQPVKSLFQRMARVVREAAQETGKEVRLVTSGEATEVDKTVVERLAEPLTHMVRNAVDHGLELASDRRAAGKPGVGTITLHAMQQSDRVVIEISDDGAGIDRDKVRARAVAAGLVEPHATLDAAGLDALLFQPGLSTSDGVSTLSGRGVGMDVVQRSIRDLNGSIAIASEPGRGCRLSISLPLTLAILDGMIVRAADQTMVVPLAAIVETQTRDAARIEAITPSETVAAMQGRFVPLVDLAEGMGFAAKAERVEEDRALLFVEADETGPFALAVDAIEAQRQVVVKGLGDLAGGARCVSAATILGDGQVALIVDTTGIAARAGLARRADWSPAQEVGA